MVLARLSLTISLPKSPAYSSDNAVLFAVISSTEMLAFLDYLSLVSTVLNNVPRHGSSHVLLQIKLTPLVKTS